jgi:hypothetical protein
MTLHLPLFGRSDAERTQQKITKQLRPAGHNAFAEWMVGFITPVGSTALVIIACYVLAQVELARILTAKGQGSDFFVAGLVFVLGAMVDTAIIVTASRFKMHIARGRRELPWAIITGVMLFLCLSVEAMTLMYFGWLVSPESVPPYVVDAVKHIHDILFFIRNGLPPVIIAFFTTCLMPLSVETSDRDRAAKASSSLNIAALQEDLVQVGLTATPEDKLTALENQIAVNEHASRATAEEHERNVALINQLRMNYGLAPRATQDALTEAQAQVMIAQAMTQFDAESVLGHFIREALGQQQADLTSQMHATVTQALQHLPTHETFEARLHEWAIQLREELATQVTALIAPLHGQLALLYETESLGKASSMTSSVAAPSDPPRQAPKPGTKRFNQLVYDTAFRLLGEDQMTNFGIAQVLQVEPEVVKEALASLNRERRSRLKAGQELAPVREEIQNAGSKHADFP